MEKFEIFTYEIDGNLYINLTSKCSNDCSFCVRNEHASYFGHKLWLSREPSADEVLARIPQDISRYKEYVFCGFGEPTVRIDTLCEIGAELKKRGAVVRLNTNGQGSMIANPGEMARHILEQVLAWTGKEPADDMTVLAVGLWAC